MSSVCVFLGSMCLKLLLRDDFESSKCCLDLWLSYMLYYIHIYVFPFLKNCKVEFIQPSNWLYSVPNLLVIQHLVTLYLDGFDVRVMSEIEWRLLKSVQENRDSRLGLAGDLRLQAARRNTCAKHGEKWTVMQALLLLIHVQVQCDLAITRFYMC